MTAAGGVLAQAAMPNMARLLSAAWALCCLMAPACGQGYSSGVVYERMRVDYAIERNGDYVKTTEFVKRLENERAIEVEGRVAIPFHPYPAAG